MTESEFATTQRELASMVEAHEAVVWAECATAASALPGDPLRVVIDRSGPVPLVALRAVDRTDFNRVVALGIQVPARVHEIDAIFSFYAAHEQHSFRIEVTPFARPHGLDASITARGLARGGPASFKLWRPVEPMLHAPAEVEVRRLDSAHTDAVASLNVLAWGAWGTPLLHAWFGATIGHPGVRHYGVFEGDRLVATGALFVHGRTGWFGFDATHPRHRGGRLRQAISAGRLRDAAALGCDVVHAESAVPPSARAGRDGWRLLYEKRNYYTVRADDSLASRGEVSPCARTSR